MTSAPATPAPMKAGLPPYAVLIAAIAVLSAMDVTIKTLSLTNHTLLVTAGRYAFGAAFGALIWRHAGAPAITAEMWRAHGLRGFVTAMSATCFFWALRVLPLAEAVTFSFIAPLIVPFAARLILGEHVRASSLLAAIIGFAGVLVAVQGGPSIEASPMHALGIGSVLTAAVTFAVSITLIRKRALTDGAPIVTFLTAFFPCLIVLGPAFVFSSPPHWGDLPLFILMGLLGAAGSFLMTRAYAAAQAQALAPLHYTELLWASLFGFAIFHEVPRMQVLAGAALIIAACLFAAWDERRLRLKAQPTA